MPHPVTAHTKAGAQPLQPRIHAACNTNHVTFTFHSRAAHVTARQPTAHSGPTFHPSPRPLHELTCCGDALNISFDFSKNVFQSVKYTYQARPQQPHHKERRQNTPGTATERRRALQGWSHPTIFRKW